MSKYNTDDGILLIKEMNHKYMLEHQYTLKLMCCAKWRETVTKGRMLHTCEYMGHLEQTSEMERRLALT